MEIYTTSTTSPLSLCEVTLWELVGTSSAFGHGTEVRVVAPFAQAMQGTSVSAARLRAAAKVTALLPINDAVVTDGGSGIHAWSPPV